MQICDINKEKAIMNWLNMRISSSFCKVIGLPVVSLVHRYFCENESLKVKKHPVANLFTRHRTN